MIFPSAVFCVHNTVSGIVLPKDTHNMTTNASVQEVSHPHMTVQNASPHDYVLPSYYSFNKGEPFYVEKDPLTGAIDFSKRTTLTSSDNTDTSTSNGQSTEKASALNPDSDYFYDDHEVEGDGIDRKDGSLQSPTVHRPNEILQNPYKISPDLHHFLNLPTQYSSSNKYPLISSSYANTKIQGTGSSSNTYSNHKYVTSSTQSPFYYTMPTTRYSTPKPQYLSTTTKATTTSTTVKSTSTTTSQPLEEEYENTDYEYEGEESPTAIDNQAVPSEYHTLHPEPTKYTVTTYRPTTYRFTTRPTPAAAPQTTEKSTQKVSIVTSLPVDVYYSSSQEPKTESSSTTQSTSTTTTTTVNSTSNTYTNAELQETHKSSESSKFHTPTEQLSTEGFSPLYGEEPFRPIFGPSNIPVKHDNDNQIQYNKQEPLMHKPTELNEFKRLPPQSNYHNQRIQPQTLPEKIEPPRPDALQTYFPDQPPKLAPGQHASISFSNPTNTVINKLIQEYERPPPTEKFQLQELQPSQSKPYGQPVYENRPIERPISTVRPRPDSEIPIKSNFKVPSKIESHFIKVTPEHENPSYSLQTSFSIGVPAGQDDKEKHENRPPQAVGQVFFPDNTPAENSPVDATNTNIPSPVLRPPNNRIPIQSYQPNRSGYRQPIHAQTRPPTQLRLPNESPAGEEDSYPRPPWEHHSKPFYGSSPNNVPKKEIILPNYYPGLNRGKPEHVLRPDLPNILPQFRPNAKIGVSEHQHTFNPPPERVKAPVDTLQPPPLPQPQHLRLNRNDDDLEIDPELPLIEKEGDLLTHRRSGPPPGRVTTLQMMQQNTQRNPDFSQDTTKTNDKDKQVFVVYPSVHRSPPQEAVVIGTRAQRPLPPDNLEKEDLDSFLLDDSKPFPIPGKERVDTPILKTKIPKPLVRNDFPYPIVKPNASLMPEERLLVPTSGVQEYTAFSPTQSSSTEETKDHDAEINVIPYLQDYMPFATKKPQSVVKPLNSIKKDTEVAPKPNRVISTMLNSSLAKTPPEKVVEKKVGSDGSEMTVSATMYTQHKPTNHKVPVTYTPSEPQPQGFQAPFLASLSAPQSHGWSVITDKTIQSATEPPTPETTDIEGSKFDIEHFKPQLFGGFKPIMPTSEEEVRLVAGPSNKNQVVLISKADREE